MRLLPIINVGLLAVSSIAVAETPAPPPPKSAPKAAPQKVQVVPVVTSAKQGLTERDTITVRGTFPNEIGGDATYQINTSSKLSKDSKLLLITLDVTAPRGAVFKRNPQPFETKVEAADLKDYSGTFTIVVATPGGKELHRFDGARK